MSQIENNRTVDVAVFRSVPYAAAPIGPLRFSPPVAFPLWQGVRNATEFRHVCVQSNGQEGDEDCLTLNIYVPRTLLEAASSSKPPALSPTVFYIHGGSLVAGSGQWEPFGDFAAFAGGGGCVAVTINYRLNIFGFLALRELAEEQGGSAGNYGIMDQQLALHWVQQHIAAFGGDRAQLTVAGQSSGGTSIFALMASPLSRGLFRAAISWSGSPNITMDASTKYDQDAPIVSTLNCTHVGSKKKVVECLRNASVADLINAIPNSWNTPGIFSLANLSKTGRLFGGLVFVDGEVVTMSFRRSLIEGLNGNVTLVLSNVGQECNTETANQDCINMSPSEWMAFLQTTFADWGNTSGIAKAVHGAYLDEASVNPQLAYDSINADYGLSCANAQLAVAAKSAVVQKFTAPIYVSINQWPPQNPNNFGRHSLAFHTWDYRAAIREWNSYAPQPMDFLLSELIRSQWYTLMSTAKMPSDWLPVNHGVPDFPAHYNTYVYSRPDRFPFLNSSGMVQSYKADRCAMVVRLIGERCMREKYERRQKVEDLHLLANYSMKLRTKIPLTLVILLLTRSCVCWRPTPSAPCGGEEGFA